MEYDLRQDSMSVLLSASRHLVFISHHYYASTLQFTCTSTSIATISARYAYAMGLLLWPSACMLCTLLQYYDHPSTNILSGCGGLDHDPHHL